MYAFVQSVTLLVNYCSLTSSWKLNRMWAATEKTPGLQAGSFFCPLFPAPHTPSFWSPGPDLPHDLSIWCLIHVSQQQHLPSGSRLTFVDSYSMCGGVIQGVLVFCFPVSGSVMSGHGTVVYLKLTGNFCILRKCFNFSVYRWLQMIFLISQIFPRIVFFFK